MRPIFSRSHLLYDPTYSIGARCRFVPSKQTLTLGYCVKQYVRVLYCIILYLKINYFTGIQYLAIIIFSWVIICTATTMRIARCGTRTVVSGLANGDLHHRRWNAITWIVYKKYTILIYFSGLKAFFTLVDNSHI